MTKGNKKRKKIVDFSFNHSILGQYKNPIFIIIFTGTPENQ